MNLDGFRLLPGAISAAECRELTEAAWAAGQGDAPFTHYRTPTGAAMRVAMTSFGPYGWVSGPQGYRYQTHHPVTGAAWTPAPVLLTEFWRRTTGRQDAPDSGLINFYAEAARMGLHQDRDEQDLSAPVVSISLGDTAIFRLGGLKRTAPTSSFRLASGDVVVLGGEARLAFHGVDRILFGSSRLVPGGGRINLTLRRAMSPSLGT